MTRSAMSVVAWTFDVSDLSSAAAELEGTLSPSERERARRLVFADKRTVYVVGRGALRRMLATELSCLPADVPLCSNEFGKPLLPEDLGVSFNLSNSEGRIALALGRGTEVGIDIERVRGGCDWLEIARRWFTARELAHISAAPAGGRDRAFFEVWTRKEAYVKAVGKGLSVPLDSFEVPIGPIRDGCAALVDDGSERWQVFAQTHDRDFVGACVSRVGARLVEHRAPPPGCARPFSPQAASDEQPSVVWATGDR